MSPRPEPCDCPTPAHCLEATGGEQGPTADELENARLRRELADALRARDEERATRELVEDYLRADRQALARVEQERDEALDALGRRGMSCTPNLDEMRCYRQRDQAREANAWLVAAIEVLVEQLEESSEWIFSNPPGDGWGLLVKSAYEEGRKLMRSSSELVERVRALLEVLR